MKRYSLLIVALIFSACATGPSGGPGGSQSVLSGVAPDGTPRWVHRGSGAFKGELGKAFYGVGLVQGIQNEALLRQTADNRARGEIAKIFHTKVIAMMKDYQRSTTAGDFKSSAEEQDVMAVQKTITEATVRGIELKDHWRDPKTGTYYALAVLELKRIIENTAGLPAATRDEVRKNAERAFEDLDKELQKRNNPPAPADPPPQAKVDPPVASDAPETPATPPTPIVRTKKGKLKVGLKIKGRDAKKIQTCFASQILEAGFELIETSNDVDVMVSGTINYKHARRNNGLIMVQANLDTRVVDMDNGKTLAAEANRIKVGRPTLTEALQSASTKLCKLVTPKVVNKIKSTFSR